MFKLTHKVEVEIAPYLVLLMGKLTKWNWPVGGGGGGDPVYLSAEATEALAAQGISALSAYLDEEIAGKVNAALEQRRSPAKASARTEELNLSRARQPVVFVPPPESADGPPGCCVEENGRLVCVR